MKLWITIEAKQVQESDSEVKTRCIEVYMDDEVTLTHRNFYITEVNNV